MLLLTASAAGPAKAQELDGDLIAAAAEYVALHAEFEVVWRGADELEEPARSVTAARMEQIEDRQNELFGALCEMHPRTPEGLRAKALAARSTIANGSSDATEPAERENWLTWSLTDDILGRTEA